MRIRPLRIAVDLMGGDFAPTNELLGALQAMVELKQRAVEIVLLGHRERLREVAQKLAISIEHLPVLHTEETIEMGDDPTEAIRLKRNSSLVRAMELHASGEVDAVVSTGNTGAILAAATLTLGKVHGVSRPTLGTLVPTEQQRPSVLLDVGANVGCKPQHLYEFAIMGSVYARELLSIERPRVALLNIGEEETKGTSTLREAYRLLKASYLNFIGNIEGRDILRGTADVVVCDGFVGNILLKFGESLAAAWRARLRALGQRGLWRRLLLWLFRPTLRRLLREFDYQNYGGVPLLGVRGVVIVGHGRSTPLAIRNMIFRAHEAIQRALVQRLEAALQVSPVSA
ncbi:MAG: phosphate acyltransferase PlsX [Candidatus Kapabacteria bacterium]|nr:phosphate acyltransferase PlsX [Candidatus Kapabacteria bacterium]MCS7169744.1 phosphate acyltransferase PlsX [Candidatus Kapabacteria bacterium]MDW7997732.1 phosphate acyltransferase PlsX [Bacteroidota bacterium]MDW8225623.1 phosphate acyltransferase PlsX [Bacteroidota bacterium]